MEPNATKPNLDTLKPIGNGVNAPQYQDSDTNNVTVKTADVHNSDTELNITASEENLSRKYKYPQKKDDAGITYHDQ